MVDKGVKIVATPEGLKIEAEGYPGTACETILGQLLPKMGLNAECAEPTPEYWQQQEQKGQNLRQ